MEVVSETVIVEMLGDEVELEGFVLDHVRDSVSVRDDFSPSVAIIVFRRDLRGGKVPVARLGVGGIGEDGGHGFVFLHQETQAE